MVKTEIRLIILFAAKDGEAVYSLKNDRMICVHFQGKPFMLIQVYATISNDKEAEVEWFCEGLQNLLELTLKKDVLFIIGDWNQK